MFTANFLGENDNLGFSFDVFVCSRHCKKCVRLASQVILCTWLRPVLIGEHLSLVIDAKVHNEFAIESGKTVAFDRLGIEPNHAGTSRAKH